MYVVQLISKVHSVQLLFCYGLRLAVIRTCLCPHTGRGHVSVPQWTFLAKHFAIRPALALSEVVEGLLVQ